MIEKIKHYVESLNLNDFDLGGCEITEEDYQAIMEKMEGQNLSLSDAVYEYLLEIREVLDDGLDDFCE